MSPVEPERITERRPAIGSPYTSFLGLEVVAPGEARLEIRPELVNPIGKLLGPVGFALVDYAMGSLVWSRLDETRQAATLNISMNFAESTDRGVVVCRAELDRLGYRVASLRASVFAADDRLLMTAVGTFAISARRLPA